MRRRLAIGALVAGGLLVAACHTTDPGTIGREYVANRNDAVDFNKYSLVSATEPAPTYARVVFRNNQTFQTGCVRIVYEDHRQLAC